MLGAQRVSESLKDLFGSWFIEILLPLPILYAIVCLQVLRVGNDAMRCSRVKNPRIFWCVQAWNIVGLGLKAIVRLGSTNTCNMTIFIAQLASNTIRKVVGSRRWALLIESSKIIGRSPLLLLGQWLDLLNIATATIVWLGNYFDSSCRRKNSWFRNFS